MKVHAALFFVLCGLLILVAETSQARPLPKMITAQFCEDETSCKDEIRRDLMLVNVEIDQNEDDSGILVFEDHKTGEAIRIRYADRSRAKHTKILSENGAFQHFYIIADRSALDGTTIIEENQVKVVRLPFGATTIGPARAK